MKYFSRVHREQTPVTGEKGLALPTIFHFRVYFIFSDFNLLIWLLRVVDFLLCLIELRWLLYLYLNFVAVNPIYVSTAGGTCSVVTSAWYIIFSTPHFPSKGHSSLVQLQGGPPGFYLKFLHYGMYIFIYIYIYIRLDMAELLPT